MSPTPDTRRSSFSPPHDSSARVNRRAPSSDQAMRRRPRHSVWSTACSRPSADRVSSRTVSPSASVVTTTSVAGAGPAGGVTHTSTRSAKAEKSSEGRAPVSSTSCQHPSHGNQRGSPADGWAGAAAGSANTAATTAAGARSHGVRPREGPDAAEERTRDVMGMVISHLDRSRGTAPAGVSFSMAAFLALNPSNFASMCSLMA